MSSYWPKTCNEIYYRHWRIQIQSLLLHPDNHPAALLCMFACMDLALSCKNEFPLFSPDRKQQNKTEDLVSYYFPPCKYSDSKKLADRLANGLKHVAFVRPGIGLQDTWNGGPRIRVPIRGEDDDIIIAPTAFWLHVERKIDEIFAEKVYPFPQRVESEECKPD